MGNPHHFFFLKKEVEVEAREAAALVLQEVRQGPLAHVQLLGHLGQFVADAGNLGKGDHILGGLRGGRGGKVFFFFFRGRSQLQHEIIQTRLQKETAGQSTENRVQRTKSRARAPTSATNGEFNPG